MEGEEDSKEQVTSPVPDGESEAAPTGRAKSFKVSYGNEVEEEGDNDDDNINDGVDDNEQLLQL